MENNWVYFALLSLILTSIGVITIKYLSTQINKNEHTITICFFYLVVSFVALLYLLYNKNDSLNFLVKYKNNYKLVAFIILLSIFTIYKTKIALNAFTITPNIGYTHLIINLNVILTTIAAYFLYNQKIKLRSFIGMVITLFGISLIVIN